MTNAADANSKAAGFTRLQAALLSAALALFIINLALIFSLGQSLGGIGEKMSAAEGEFSNALKALEKPKISITYIADSSCRDCFSLQGIADAVKQLGAEITGEQTLEFSSAEAKALIAKYEIGKVPAMVVSGETGKVAGLAELWASLGSAEDDNALVLRNVQPVYLELAANAYRGRVRLTLLTDSNCTKCSEPLGTEQFSAAGVKVVSEVVVSFQSADGKRLIEQYAIEKLPATVVSDEIKYYEGLSAVLSTVGTFEADGNFVVREARPVYFDISKGREIGYTDVIYLTDAECTECYDVNMHKGILENNFAVEIASESYVDVSSSEGVRLVEDYNIVNIPTIILSGDVSAYTSLVNVWQQVGTVETDGTYIFRSMGVLSGSTYKNLSTGEVVKPATQ